MWYNYYIMDQIFNTPPQETKKKMKAFWPVVIIVLVAALAAGVVLNFSYNSVIQDELDSLIFKTHKK